MKNSGAHDNGTHTVYTQTMFIIPAITYAYTRWNANTCAHANRKVPWVLLAIRITIYYIVVWQNIYNVCPCWIISFPGGSGFGFRCHVKDNGGHTRQYIIYTVPIISSSCINIGRRRTRHIFRISKCPSYIIMCAFTFFLRVNE